MSYSPPAKRANERKDDFRCSSRHGREPFSIPSPVVFIKGLRSNAFEADFHDALSQFGNIAYVLCMGDKALVEFETLRSAKECVMQGNVGSIKIAGHSVDVEFSRSESIRRSGLESQYANNVLIISVYNIKHQVNVDVIYQISSLHGRVLRIAMLKGTNGADVQALVEFDSVVAAKSAKHSLNGADIYSGCCTLKVEFSKVKTVSVTQNSHDQWDYTLNSPTLPSVAPAASGYGCEPYTRPSFHHDYYDGARSVATYDTLKTSYSFPVDHLDNSSEFQKFAQPKHPRLFNKSAPVDASNGRKRKLDTYLSLPSDYHSEYHPDDYRLVSDYYRSRSDHRDDSRSVERVRAKGCVLMLYDLDPDHFNCEKVFNLLCSFGDCLKTKFLNTQFETCMVEMRTTHDADNVIKYLNHQKIYGRRIQVSYSRQESIHLPSSRDVNKIPKLADGTRSFMEFTRSHYFRFENSQVAAKNRLAYPSPNIHFYGAPPNYTEESVRNIFEKEGITPTEIVILKKNAERSLSGFARFSSTEKAFDALIVCNHTSLRDTDGQSTFVFKLAFAFHDDK